MRSVVIHCPRCKRLVEVAVDVSLIIKCDECQLTRELTEREVALLNLRQQVITPVFVRAFPTVIQGRGGAVRAKAISRFA